jgi:serine/threonine protein kinase
MSTKQYGAPEMLAGSPFTEKADIWGVGCVMYELFTGRIYSDDFHLYGQNWEQFLLSYGTPMPIWLQCQQNLCSIDPNSRMRAWDLKWYIKANY